MTEAPSWSADHPTHYSETQTQPYQRAPRKAALRLTQHLANAVDPLRLSAYLREASWTREEADSTREIWTLKGSGGQRFHIFLPLDKTHPSYRVLIGKAVDAIASAEAWETTAETTITVPARMREIFDA